jgi:thioredoxin-like negative regulator of GroEL
MFAGIAFAVMAVAAAGSGIAAWINRPAAQEAAFARTLSHTTGANVTRYTQAAFDQAQAAGDPILIAIQAKWCPTCAAQQPIIEKIAAEGAGKNLRVLLVDFDTQKDVVRSLGATMQSTLVVFHGKDEMARTVGDTDSESIRATVRRTLI